MNDGDGVYRIVNPTEKKVLLSYTLYTLKDGSCSVEELYDFTTDTFDTSSTFTGEDKHLDTAIFGGEYMIDLDDAVFVFPIAFIPPGVNYNTYEVSCSGCVYFVTFSVHNGRSVDPAITVGSESVTLVPSQSIEGGERQVSMGNKDIITWYVLVPMNDIETGKILPLRKGTANIAAIPPTLDQ